MKVNLPYRAIRQVSPRTRFLTHALTQRGEELKRWDCVVAPGAGVVHSENCMESNKAGAPGAGEPGGVNRLCVGTFHIWCICPFNLTSKLHSTILKCHLSKLGDDLFPSMTLTHDRQHSPQSSSLKCRPRGLPKCPIHFRRPPPWTGDWLRGRDWKGTSVVKKRSLVCRDKGGGDIFWEEMTIMDISPEKYSACMSHTCRHVGAQISLWVLEDVCSLQNPGWRFLHQMQSLQVVWFHHWSAIASLTTEREKTEVKGIAPRGAAGQRSLVRDLDCYCHVD